MGKHECSGNFHGSIREKILYEKKILRVFCGFLWLFVFLWRFFYIKWKFQIYFHGLMNFLTFCLKHENQNWCDHIYKNKDNFLFYRKIRCNRIKNKSDLLSKKNTTWPLSTQQNPHNKNPTLFPLTVAWLIEVQRRDYLWESTHHFLFPRTKYRINFE